MAYLSIHYNWIKTNCQNKQNMLNHKFSVLSVGALVTSTDNQQPWILTDVDIFYNMVRSLCLFWWLISIICVGSMAVKATNSKIYFSSQLSINWVNCMNTVANVPCLSAYRHIFTRRLNISPWSAKPRNQIDLFFCSWFCDRFTDTN